MAGKYNLINEYSEVPDTDDISSSPHWVMAVVRLGLPLSYSRLDKKSVTLDVTEGAKTRGEGTLVITGDCVQMQVTNAKENHVKSLTATMIQTDTNYLVEILPGDWILAWIVHGEDRQLDLVKRIKKGAACNWADDGFKFLGRVEGIRKHTSRDGGSGTKTTRYQLQAHGFRELDSQIFYDKFLSEKSLASGNIGRWLTKIGIDIRQIFAIEADEQKDNVHLLIPTFLELIMGIGVGEALNTVDDNRLRQVAGGGITEGKDGKTTSAPFAYLVPKEVGDLIGKNSRDAAKASGILAYADILDLVFGVQKYEDSSSEGFKIFAPKIADDNPLTNGNHYFTGKGLQGAFLPLMPNFDNRPLWDILRQYLNPVLNEMYTCLRVNRNGKVLPTMVLRQIPFTTDVLADKIENKKTGTGENGPAQQITEIALTRYSELPRWSLPGVMVHTIDIGRSDVTRCNFVHVYGQDADNTKNVSITAQLVQNPPVRDDLDIQRSGLHTYMTTVACRAINAIGTTPSVWMEIIADHRIGSQYTLNGTIETVGISAPICEGDNLEFDGVLYHIESVTHRCSIDSGSGKPTFSTVLTLTNGLRTSSESGGGAGSGGTTGGNSDTSSEFPIYPGFNKKDNTLYDPGISVDNVRDGDVTGEKTSPGKPFDSGVGSSDDTGEA